MKSSLLSYYFIFNSAVMSFFRFESAYKVDFTVGVYYLLFDIIIIIFSVSNAEHRSTQSRQISTVFWGKIICPDILIVNIICPKL